MELREYCMRSAWSRKRRLLGALILTSGLLLGAAHSPAGAAPGAPVPSTIASTVPANGDVNPYGVAVVPAGSGKLIQGAILVSNFNDKKNQQGTGTTIMQITPGGAPQLFAHIDPANLPGACPGGIGLTTALAVLQRGYVIVGSLPTSDGTAATAKAGCLLVINSAGQVVSTISNANINGPWDMAAYDGGSTASLFVTNVLNGTVAAGKDGTSQGTIVRVNLRVPQQGIPRVVSTTVIGSGFAERADPNALVIGPTGLALGSDGTLYIADTLENRIAAIPHALTHATNAHTGDDFTAAGFLNGPLGLAILPDGDILAVNANDGRIVRIAPSGKQLSAPFLDKAGTPPGTGTLFGLAVAPDGKSVYFVDDGMNNLRQVTAALL